MIKELKDLADFNGSQLKTATPQEVQLLLDELLGSFWFGRMDGVLFLY